MSTNDIERATGINLETADEFDRMRYSYFEREIREREAELRKANELRALLESNRCKGCRIGYLTLYVCESCKRPQKERTYRTATHAATYELLTTLRVQQSMSPVEKQIVLNAQIIHKTRFARNHDSTSHIRRNMAIYRLYRYCDIPLWMIADTTTLSDSRLKMIIGSVFSALCMSDKACVFKQILQDVYSRHT